MSFTFLNQLPTPAQIKEEYPLSKELTELKAKRDAMISDVICGKDDRFLVIIGPCSADNEDSVCDYVSRLTKIQEDVKDRVIIIPRVYTNKPRTTGEGYKGIASQPDPEKAPDMVEGLIAMRKCTSVPSQRVDSPVQMRCFTLRTGAMLRIFSHMWQSVLVLLRINSIVSPSVASMWPAA